MEKQKIMLDSCCFFETLWYNEYFKKFGIEAYKKNLSKKLNNIENIVVYQLEKYYTEEFKAQTTKKSILGKLFDFKNYMDKQMSILSKKLDEIKTVYRNNKINNTLTQKQLEELDNAYKNVKTAKENLAIKMNAFYRDYSNFRSIFDTAKYGMLYYKYIKGEIEFYLPYTGYKEIINHIRPKNKEDYKPKRVYYDESFINSLLNECIMISFASPESVKEVCKLAKKFMKRNKNFVNCEPMNHDKNSNGEYGDAKIMATANFAGIILLTENGKDFIFKDEFDNRPFKRNHIMAVCKNNEPRTTDAFAYSVNEYITNDYIKPTKTSSLTKHPHSRHTHRKLKNEIVY